MHALPLRSHSLKIAARRPIAWLAALLLSIIGLGAIGAPAAAADGGILSPGVPQESGVVSGNVYVDREGLQTVTDANDVYLNGVRVCAYWQDEDGLISPTYCDVTRTIGGEDGQFAIYMKPWTDANGKTHMFNGAASEKLRVWSDNPDPEKYSPSFQESLGGMGTMTARDAAAWFFLMDSSGGGYVYNWILTYQDVAPEHLQKPADQQVASTATGSNANLFGTLSGSVFWEVQHAWGATLYPDYLGDDKPGVGYTVRASYLTNPAVAIFDAYKNANNPSDGEFAAWQ